MCHVSRNASPKLSVAVIALEKRLSVSGRACKENGRRNLKLGV